MKFSAVKIDQTSSWNDEIQEKAGKIFQVCVFNPEEQTLI